MASKIVIAVIFSVFISLVYGSSIQIPDECEGKAYCDIKPVGFPQELFDDHVRQKEKMIVRSRRNQRYQGEPREQIFNSDEYNCHTRVSIIQPFIVRSNTTMKLVVQSSIFEQWVKRTECLETGSPCFKDVLKPSYTSACTPTDSTIKLYLYDPQTKRFEREGVTFPVCCHCSIISKY